jgi:dolichol-phosphate mannosyltransferase
LRLYPQPMASPSSRPSRQLSVIIPTYEEKDNIRPLTERLFKAVKEAGIETELLFMDDESKDTEATEKIVAELQRQGYLVRIHTRRKTEGRGLSSAVLLGFDKARYDTMLCMDADLQHEPESVPAVADPVLRQEAEFSVGSRHVGGGGLGFNWSIHRRLISAIATMLAFPLTSSTDPMSGFFCTSKRVMDGGLRLDFEISISRSYNEVDTNVILLALRLVWKLWYAVVVTPLLMCPLLFKID